SLRIPSPCPPRDRSGRRSSARDDQYELAFGLESVLYGSDSRAAGPSGKLAFPRGSNGICGIEHRISFSFARGGSIGGKGRERCQAQPAALRAAGLRADRASTEKLIHRFIDSLLD